MQFWHELAAEMSREWFTANRARYDALWRLPMTALIEQIARRLAPTYRPLRLDPPGLLRIHRDLRFSRDRTPYKTCITAVLRPAGAPIAHVGNAALYLELGLDSEYAGVGCYQFNTERMARWRRAVVGAPGAALLAILARLRRAGHTVSEHDDYHRMPRGFADDHPRAALLRKRGLACAFPAIPAGLLHEPALADWLVGHARAAAPLVIWLQRHVR
ncbi:MAG TPA: DUF2461 domain-containing protein [Kofleriaceae bacterium]|nr:DUF2461 domain-containing protein [Kofleriaceae bacterium]